MNKRFTLLVSFVLLSVIVLTACAPAATEPPSVIESNQRQAIADGAPALAPEEAFGQSGGEAPAADEQKVEGEPSVSQPEYAIGAPENPALSTAGHMIIKNANLQLLVEDTDVALDRATQVVGDLGGYIISSRIWYQDWYDEESYMYATLTMGIPVVEFEHALTRLRGLSIKVLNEEASGDDVTDQYVDLQSQLTNLEATRERIKTFLEQAKTVDEALRINQELAEIERQIEEIKGRMNYLEDRSSFSTITANFEPQLPELLPEPTPMPDPWDPGETFKNAKETLTSAYQGIVDFLIWVFVVFVPIFAPPVVIIWIIWRVLKRRMK